MPYRERTIAAWYGCPYRRRNARLLAWSASRRYFRSILDAPHLRADPVPAARAAARRGGVHLPRHGDLVRLRHGGHADRHPGAGGQRVRVALARRPRAPADRAPRRHGDPEPVPPRPRGRALVEALRGPPGGSRHLEGPRVPAAPAPARNPQLLVTVAVFGFGLAPAVRAGLLRAVRRRRLDRLARRGHARRGTRADARSAR